ncbi:hypothetical protein K0A97_02910 [Patescibacteria group bacterium]|nr:hypothetical protein [Patescibacteria group bacterium]
MKLKLTQKIWVLIIVVIFSLISIFGLPPAILDTGVLITSVELNSTAFEVGFREGQIINEINDNPIKDASDFSRIILEIFASNESQIVKFKTKNSEIIYFSNEIPQMTISDTPASRIKFGLDIIGGARALVKAEDKDLTAGDVRDLISITENRLNEFGLTDLHIRHVSDLEGNNFMLVEIAGATPKDLENLIAQQGKFEAKIGNETVFIGGIDNDIASVCRRDNNCAFIEKCQQSQDGSYFCNFRFEVTLSPEAAKRHADITDTLEVNVTPQGKYLSLPLDLYLDDVLMDSLLISEGLKGRITTQVVVSGSASGETRDVAITAAEAQMNHLQTILITGSLPFSLEIVKLDTISPLLGPEFLRMILIAGLSAIGAVALVVFVRYRKFKASLALVLTSISEIIIILGIAALIDWNLDLPSIAGILIVVGTGIDQQIIILDESQRGAFLSLKQKMKRAFAIIIGAYFTSVVAMLPLLWAGAGLLRGFAFTTIIGISAGVLITRPAFSDIIKRIEKE